MRSSSLFVGLSAATLASASYVKRDATCNGEVFDGICCVSGEWAGEAVSKAISSDFSAASTFYTAYSSSISTAVAGEVSQVSTFISANSQSLHNDYTSMSSSISAFAATFTPPPDPYAKRDTVTIHESSIQSDVNNWRSTATAQESSIQSDVNNWRSSADAFEKTYVPPTWTIPDVTYTWTPPEVIVDKRETVTIQESSIQSDVNNWRSSADAFEKTYVPPTWTIPDVTYTWAPPEVIVDKRETVTIQESSIQSDANRWRSSADAFEKTFVPPTWTIPDVTYTWAPPDVIFDKRAVSVVSKDLTCHGQAVVTLSATDASSLIASATSAAKGKLYYANGSTLTPTATSTSVSSSSSAGSAAKITRGPMLAVGGAAVAFAFAAM